MALNTLQNTRLKTILSYGLDKRVDSPYLCNPKSTQTRADTKAIA